MSQQTEYQKFYAENRESEKERKIQQQQQTKNKDARKYYAQNKKNKKTMCEFCQKLIRLCYVKIHQKTSKRCLLCQNIQREQKIKKIVADDDDDWERCSKCGRKDSTCYCMS